MPRYDQTLARKVARALELAGGDLREAFEQAEELGISPEAFEQALKDDLHNGGRIFGKLKSNLMGAAEVATITAHGQGVTVGEAIGSGYVDITEMDDAEVEALLSGNDPAAMDTLEKQIGDRAYYTWVATLVNTCPYCLALHGKSMTKDEWKAAGYDPETIHSEHSINSPCYCRFVLDVPGREDDLSTVEPLRRTQVEGRKGTTGNRKTIRSVTQPNPDKAMAGAERALGSKSGKAALRAMGNSAPPEVAAAVRAARAAAREERDEKK